MKKAKPLILFITAVIILTIGYFFYINNRFWKNVRNSEKIKIGMSPKEVLEIMGPPKKALKSYLADSDSLYFYQPPIMASEGIEVFFFKGHVNRISKYKST